MICRLMTLTLLLSLLALPAFAFKGAASGKCSDCHTLTVKDATALLKGVDKVLNVEFAEVPGFWIIDAEKAGQKFPIFLDFTKKYVIAGSVIKIATGEDLTQQRIAKLNNGKVPTPAPNAATKKVDIKSIPVDDAILLGKADARIKVVVFTDPECPYCKKLHSELQEIVKADANIAFLIKLMPLVKIHPNAYGIAKTILCSGNPLAVLEASFSGAPVVGSACPTTRVDESMNTAQQLGITSTPTLILADGTVLPGYRKADDLLKILGSKGTVSAGGK